MTQTGREDTHPDFVEGYIDGRDLNCPEPNENRSERYKHSFKIGGAEAAGKDAGSYEDNMAGAKLADFIEENR